MALGVALLCAVTTSTLAAVSFTLTVESDFWVREVELVGVAVACAAAEDVFSAPQAASSATTTTKKAAQKALHRENASLNFQLFICMENDAVTCHRDLFFCIVAQRRGFVKLLQRNSNKTATIWDAKGFSIGRSCPRSGLMRAKSANTARSRELAGARPHPALRGRLPRRGRLRLSKKVRLPLAPLRGAPAAAGGERTVRQPEIFRAMARFSPSAPTGHLPRRGRFFDTLRLPRRRLKPLYFPSCVRPRNAV